MGSMLSSLKGGEANNKPEEQKGIPSLANEYVVTPMGKTEFLKKLDVNNVDAIEDELKSAIAELNKQEGLNPFRIGQLQEMINRGLEKEICIAQEIPFIEEENAQERAA